MTFHGVQGAEDYDGFPKGYAYMFAEPKFDGYRLASVIVDGVVTFYCREPKPVMWGANLDHIRNELLELGFDNCMVDGEVMANDWNKTGIIRLGCGSKGYKRPSDEVLAEIHRETKYYVFDWVDLTKVMHVENRQKKMVPIFPMPLEARQAELATYLRGAELTDILRPVQSERVTSEAELQAAYQRALTQGYEGLILKFPASLYAFMKNKCWRKLKPHETIELQVVEVVEGEGKHRGRLGALRCVKKDGTEVSVGTGWNDPERERVYRERAQIPGKIIECEIATSAAAKARHPAFKRWREDRTSL